MFLELSNMWSIQKYSDLIKIKDKNKFWLKKKRLLKKEIIIQNLPGFYKCKHKNKSTRQQINKSTKIIIKSNGKRRC